MIGDIYNNNYDNDKQLKGTCSAKLTFSGFLYVCVSGVTAYSLNVCFAKYVDVLESHNCFVT